MLVTQSSQHIKANGLILFEIDSRQNTSALNIASEVFPGARVCVVNDLSGMPRYVQILLDEV